MFVSLVFWHALSASSATIDVPIIGQDTKDWCWAASTEMLAQYLGTYISQCEQVNASDGRSDCCTTPTPAACIHGGEADFEHWDLRQDKESTVLSFAQLKAEIDAGRPFYFTWRWTGGGGHAMVVSGYSDDQGEQQVRITNPEPQNIGSVAWRSYDYWVSSSTHHFGHTRIHIAQDPPCHSSYNDVSLSDFQKCFTHWQRRHQFATTISESTGDHGTVMGGSFRSAGSGPVYSDMTANAFQAKFASYANAGWFPDTISVLGESGGARFSVIWQPAPAGGFVTQPGLLAETLVSEDDKYWKAGAMMTDVASYNDADGTPRFVATWAFQANAGYFFQVGLSEAEYLAAMHDIAVQGFQPVRFSAYATTQGTRYVALWHASTKPWVQYFDETDAHYQAHFNTLDAQGFVVTHLSVLGDRYAAIWSHP